MLHASSARVLAMIAPGRTSRRGHVPAAAPRQPLAFGLSPHIAAFQGEGGLSCRYAISVTEPLRPSSPTQDWHALSRHFQPRELSTRQRRHHSLCAFRLRHTLRTRIVLTLAERRGRNLDYRRSCSRRSRSLFRTFRQQRLVRQLSSKLSLLRSQNGFLVNKRRLARTQTREEA